MPEIVSLPKDILFESDKKPGDFSFNSEVASVFDDMVSRSVPLYYEMQHMISELANEFSAEHTQIYDIGCSTGTTLALLDRSILSKEITLIGIDNSREMLKKAKDKLSQAKLSHPFDLKLCDIHRKLPIHNASVITMILTLQFARPLYRERIVRRLYEGLNPEGCLLLVEKVTSADTIFNRLFIERYYDFKRRNGYSETEIAKKREALENVLIPYRMEENLDLLKSVGFKHIEIFLRWYNFCGIIAVK